MMGEGRFRLERVLFFYIRFTGDCVPTYIEGLKTWGENRRRKPWAVG
jgi:hypothetical protein